MYVQVILIEIGRLFQRIYLKHWDIRKNSQENHEMGPKQHFGPYIVTEERPW